MLARSLKDRLANRDLLVGTFLKTPSPILVEVLALTQLDCICIDAEHAPFDRSAIDACVMASRVRGIDVVVRIPATTAEHVLNALDCGATGIVAPHIRSAEEASALVAMSRYGHGGRGYAGSSRAANYTTRSMPDHIAASAARTVVIAQIEDPEAIEQIDEIAAVEGIDALFVGRADLTVAYGVTNQDDARVVAAVEAVCTAGVRHGRPVGMFLAREGDTPLWTAKGASLFLLGSDHAFLLGGARRLVEAVRGV
jgi:2-keto-3-deoxy-L-rhamnonate aldolase RhmA